MPTSVSDMIIMVSIGVLLLLGFKYSLDWLQMWIVHKTIRNAIRENPTGTATFLEKLSDSTARTQDDRAGLILVAIGVALIGFSLIVGDPDWLRYGLGASLFPLFVGAVLLLRFYSLRSRDAGL